MSSAAAPAVRGPGGHRGTEQGRPGAAGTGPLPSSTRVNSGVAGARCPAQGRRGLEGSRRVYERPAAHKGVAAAHRLGASAARHSCMMLCPKADGWQERSNIGNPLKCTANSYR